jgi:hypothetical protein
VKQSIWHCCALLILFLIELACLPVKDFPLPYDAPGRTDSFAKPTQNKGALGGSALTMAGDYHNVSDVLATMRLAVGTKHYRDEENVECTFSRLGTKQGKL